ncbi:related to leupaxin [Rhynchosporium secalis]|uniref:Related to leupaxin n=1 Tax=Rhynchosporium secalis TaxID=38038 RepID=A0A1E1MG50_RHYSE|nr:related to leupaxin [Rhynchosporium secalis]
MLSRGRSKDSKDRNRKVTPPGPVYMSNDQFANYLSDLRTNRVTRPSGARPLPASNRRDSDRGLASKAIVEPAPISPVDSVPRSSSVLSHRRAQSSLSTYSSVTSRTGRQLVQSPTPSEKDPKPLKASDVVPTATYMERGSRWMEKEEAVSLREAMEDMAVKPEIEEELRIHKAAQDEASELVYQHQFPQPAIQPDAPFKYKDHLRKNSYQHARAQSVGRYNGLNIATGLARDMPRSVSGGSNSSGGLQSPRSRISSEGSDYFRQRAASPEAAIRASAESARDIRPSGESRKSFGSLASSVRPLGSRRKASGKRNISGEVTSTFTGEQIWEEPEQDSADRGSSSEGHDMPEPLRIKPRNPLNRVQFAQDMGMGARSQSTPPEPTKRFSASEIHRNPPSQSRNPNYTANPLPEAQRPKFKPVADEEEPAVPMKDGLEIRSEDIRQATSMRLKDRSPKLPTPTAVSNKPGRPIVSFDSNWKPNEADVKPEVRRRSPFDRINRGSPSSQRQSLPARSDSKDVPSNIPTIQLPVNPPTQVKKAATVPIPSINSPDSQPSVPTINVPDSRPSVRTINHPASTPTIPSIKFPDSAKPNVPTINFPDSAPSIPTINLPDAPQISISAPSIPQITVGNASISPSTRPLPTPKPSAGRTGQRQAPPPVSRGHWSPAGRRATATCHQCQLPIEGKVCKLSGGAEHFHPECFICFTCGTGLESLEIHPEPKTKCAERLDRIRRRAQGEHILEVEGATMAEDGDERLRFYCHLDFHELFAPRCKHCTTPIIGEHMVALGQSWHYGHFFCAECGDPFLAGDSHIEKDGYAWCLNCQTKRTERQAPKCKKCNLAVIGEYVQALGGEWHEKCFRCATCQSSFDDGAFFPLKMQDGGTAVLCVRCIERELKK